MLRTPSCARRFIISVAGALVLFASVSHAAETGTLPDDLERAHEMVEQHRYSEVIEVLAPYEAEDLNPEAAYIVAAEGGRAHFHLGRYQEAHARFRTAVTLHPDRLETALYLQATSYLLGHREQALAIFREVVRGGARDLWLATTLPGERSFLADEEVWRIVQDHAVPLDVDLEQGSLLGAAIGDSRVKVVETLGAGPANLDAPVLTAHAGPKMIWAFDFGDDGLLAEIAVQADHLLRYTPYRLKFDCGLDWQATPVMASGVLGPPQNADRLEDGDLVMVWEFEGISLGLTFGEPPPPRPPVLPRSGAVLRLVHLKTVSTDDPAPVD